jgi:two-component system CheB/CheR fusion protein
MRRIQRRMQVLQTDEVPSYIEQLRTQPTETELLFRELLIGVTRFFRDAAAFEALETKVIPGMLADPSRSDPLRVWVAGCATGEEAYSIAILLKEGLVRSESRRPVQIFSTDVDDRAIEAARAGLYPASIASDLSAERLERNFIQENSSYRVTKDIRELCLFSTHDLGKDPPFSRLDLVSCRNLMNFEPRLQQRVLTTFHYALRPGCHLFLGPSESITSQPRLFAPLDNRHRLFARRDTAATFPALSLSRSPGRLPSARRTATADDNESIAGQPVPWPAMRPRSSSLTGNMTFCGFLGRPQNISSRRRVSQVLTCLHCCTPTCGRRRAPLFRGPPRPEHGFCTTISASKPVSTTRPST